MGEIWVEIDEYIAKIGGSSYGISSAKVNEHKTTKNQEILVEDQKGPQMKRYVISSSRKAKNGRRVSSKKQKKMGEVLSGESMTTSFKRLTNNYTYLCNKW